MTLALCKRNADQGFREEPVAISKTVNGERVKSADSPATRLELDNPNQGRSKNLPDRVGSIKPLPSADRALT